MQTPAARRADHPGAQRRYYVAVRYPEPPDHALSAGLARQGAQVRDSAAKERAIQEEKNSLRAGVVLRR